MQNQPQYPQQPQYPTYQPPQYPTQPPAPPMMMTPAHATAPSALACTSCLYEGTRSVPMVHSDGISTNTSRTTGVGLSRGGLGVGTATTRGTSQTNLSQRLAPPAKARWMRTLLLGFFASVFAASVAGGITATLIVFVGWGLTAYFAWQGFQHNREEHPALLDRWNRSFLCDRCGTVFLPGGIPVLPAQPAIPS